jgi:hypothetical protein
MLGWLNERDEVVEKCSMIMKNKSVYEMLVEKRCKKIPVRNQEVNGRLYKYVLFGN